ncbi:UbiA family prenyltransferase [Haloarchaeobius sp. HRN-SO-5]|uniref:UbiA family prenyltransferase n=1 Tax=Haloarchaeobius sp. HRN-SO-5 TaxID=3446118 RepID=UPI003EC03D76
MSQSNEPFRLEDDTYSFPSFPDPAGPLRTVTSVAVHGSVLDGVVAATKVAVVSLLLSIPLSPALAVAGLVTFAVYGSNKFVDAEDEVNCPDRAAFVARYRRPLLAATLGALGVALTLAAVEGLDSMALTLVPLLAALLYSLEWVPLDGGTRLKDVLFVNTALVASAWAVFVTFLPVAWVDVPVTPAAVVVCLFFFVQTVVAGEVLNARDVVGDRAEGVSTLSTVLGVPRTRHLLVALDGLTLVLLAASVVTGALSATHALALVPAVAYSLAITSLLGLDVDRSRLGTCRDAQYGLLLVCVWLVA